MNRRIGVRASSGFSGTSSPRLPKLDGKPAEVCAKSPNANEKRMYCSLCGAKGHQASAHLSGKAVLDPEPSGEAISQNRATQFGTNDSPLTTGNGNYKSPGYEGGMS